MEPTTVAEERPERPEDPARRAGGDSRPSSPTVRRAGSDQEERGLRFEDPYWDDAFCAWWDPTLRTCC